MIDKTRLRMQYLIGFLNGLSKSGSYDYGLEKEYKARLDELERLTNEDTVDKNSSYT